MMRKYKGFISYAHKDNENIPIAQTFIDRFKLYANNQNLSSWHDKDINTGQKWFEEIQNAIKNCDFGLLLISEAFVSSTFIQEHEFDILQSLAHEKKIFPILLANTNFESDAAQTKWKQLFEKQFYKFNDKSYVETCMTPDGGTRRHDPGTDSQIEALVNEIKNQLLPLAQDGGNIQKEEESTSFLNFLVDRNKIRQDFKDFIDGDKNKLHIGFIKDNDIPDDIASWIETFSDDRDLRFLKFMLMDSSTDDLISEILNAVEVFRNRYGEKYFEHFYNMYRSDTKKEITISDLLNTLKELFLIRHQKTQEQNWEACQTVWLQEIKSIKEPLLVLLQTDSSFIYKKIKKLLFANNAYVKFVVISSVKNINNDHSNKIFLNKVTGQEIREYLDNKIDIPNHQIESIMQKVHGNQTHNEIKKIMMETLNLTSAPKERK